RHGGDFESYLACRAKAESPLPNYMVKVREGNEERVEYFCDEADLRKFHEQNLDLNLLEEETGQEIAPANVAARKEGPRRRGKLIELHESTAIQKLIGELARKGL